MICLSFVKQARVFLFPKVQDLRLSKAITVSGMTLNRSISLQTPCFATVVEIAKINSINTTRHQIEVAATLIIRWVVTNTHPFLDSAHILFSLIPREFINARNKNIAFDNCGRRHRLHDYRGMNANSTVSGMFRNWLDVDGSASGLGEPVVMGSGQPEARLWWNVENNDKNDVTMGNMIRFIRLPAFILCTNLLF